VAAMSLAVNSADLPRLFEAGGYRIGTLRLGAFAPQLDPVFNSAAEEAEKLPGATEDGPMLAGFCAVARRFIAEADTVAAQSDILLLDLRGNLGGLGREARLLASALLAAPLPRAFDVFHGDRHGRLRLKEVAEDPSCGRIANPRPLIVLTDAGTRSAGELTAAWLWGGGALLAGERSIGAGGGFDMNKDKGLALPRLGVNVRSSTNFTFFDASGTLHGGDYSEQALLAVVAQDGFAPSRTRAFAIQAVGMRPDLERPTSLEDLRDGGKAYVGRIVEEFKRGKLLP
jgi:hypothetical protein